jgi:glycosyltransferase involved in cell wall biosynthesis
MLLIGLLKFIIKLLVVKMSKPKLIVIPNDPLMAYVRKGFSESERHEYFNPNEEFDVAIFSLNYYIPSFAEGGNLKKYDEYAGFKVYNIEDDLSNLEESLDSFSPNLIRGYGNGARLAGEIGKCKGIPSFASIHNLFPEDGLRYVDRVFAVSNESKNKCIEFGIEGEKIVILPDRVNMGVFYDRRGLEEVDLLNDKYRSRYKIVSAGRLNWQKNLENLFEASGLVKNVLEDVTHLHIGGYGDQKDALVEKAGLYPHIKLLSDLDQNSLSAHFSWADLFAMASISEGFGLVYAESLASGTPVVTSNLFPMKDYIIEGFNGKLVNPNSSDSIANGIIEILSNKDLLSKLRKNARKSVEQFDSKELQRREAYLYKETL